MYPCTSNSDFQRSSPDGNLQGSSSMFPHTYDVFYCRACHRGPAYWNYCGTTVRDILLRRFRRLQEQAEHDLPVNSQDWRNYFHSNYHRFVFHRASALSVPIYRCSLPAPVQRNCHEKSRSGIPHCQLHLHHELLYATVYRNRSFHVLKNRPYHTPYSDISHFNRCASHSLHIFPSASPAQHFTT